MTGSTFNRCRFGLALLAFILINAGVAASVRQLPFMARTAEEKGIVFQAANSAVDQYQHLSAAPGIVLMGSSVMMAPLWSCDSSAFPQTADIYHHHVSLSLNSLLASAGVGGKSFAFALPGAMVSDMYLIADKLLKDNMRPKVIVYGLSPRDFMDDLLTGETRTAVFKRLSDISDLAGNSNLYLSTWTEKSDFLLDSVVFLYGKRCRYQDKLGDLMQHFVSQLSQTAVKPAQATEAGFAFAQSGLQNKVAIWRKSIEEYHARYRRFNEKQFDKQRDFLAALLETARRRQIKVIVVNMPLTMDNISLMPVGLYSKYKATLTDTSTKYGATYLDLQNGSKYDNACFYDTVHLNADGGRKFLSALATSVGRSM